MRRRSRLPALFSLMAFAMVLLALAVAVGLTLSYPARAESRFGPPTPGLGFLQTVRLSIQLLRAEEQLLTPTQPESGNIAFTVHSGDSSGAIMQQLESAGLIPDAETMTAYLIYKGLDTGILTGDYTLSPRVPPVQVVQAIMDPNAADVAFVVLPGWRVEEIAGALPTSGLPISSEAFLNEARNRPNHAYIQQVPDGATYPIEGYLLPGTYSVARTTDARGLIDILLRGFGQAVTPETAQGLLDQGLTLHEGIIVASIVERESRVDDEKALIASVYLNRLAIGMRLQADPTVQYALGFNSAQGSWWTSPLSLANLEVFSPYNTYQNDGLPPGPIANPTVSSIEATAFPAESPYYFFQAACDGSGRHVFAVTFEEHLGNSCQ